jgi:predicted DNA-binding transcriptional regulator AlpA
MRRLGTKKQVAQLLGRHPESVMRDVREGRLPAPARFGIGKTARVYFDLDEVEAAVERHFAEREAARRHETENPR